MMHECKTCTYEQVIYPGEQEAKDAAKKKNTGYHYQRQQEELEKHKKLEYGILNKLFLEEGEEVEKEVEIKLVKNESVHDGPWNIREHGHEQNIRIKNRNDRDNRMRHHMHHHEYDSEEEE